MSSEQLEIGLRFESDVRKIARQLYPNGRATGSAIVQGQERDEIIDTGDQIVIVEATTSRAMEKVKKDVSKSIELVRSLRKNTRFNQYTFRIFIITKFDPTADQIAYVKNAQCSCPLTIISFHEFCSKLFDGKEYIRKRADHPFGSIRNIDNEKNIHVDRDEYIPNGLFDIVDQKSLNAKNVLFHNINRDVITFLGEFGSGKSMTLRDVYFTEVEKYQKGDTLICPIYLNLRDHIAQDRPSEALDRHGATIGFANPYELVAAWKAGNILLFLDGFDELTPPQFAVSVKDLRDARQKAVSIVRNFLKESTVNSKILIAGRQSYFDDLAEMRLALGLPKDSAVLQVAGFDEEQASLYLRSRTHLIPSWLPTRPLLLGYLAKFLILENSAGRGASLSPAEGWNFILDSLCERDVQQIWGVNLETAQLRAFVERLATISRKKVGQSPTIEIVEVTEAYRTVFGQEPAESDILLSLRLPGLIASPAGRGAREFVDDALLAAMQAGDVLRYIENPYVGPTPLADCKRQLSALGIDVILQQKSRLNATSVSIALHQIAQDNRFGTAVTDCINIMCEGDMPYQYEDITISGSDIGEIWIDGELDFSKLTFHECIIGKLELTRSSKELESKNYPKFVSCMIETIDGAIGRHDIPSGVICSNTDISSFMNNINTNDSAHDNLERGIAILVSILRKLFIQPGLSRERRAIYRGLPDSDGRYIDSVLQEVLKCGFAKEEKHRGEDLIIASRDKNGEAHAILNAPNNSSSNLVAEVRKLEQKWR